MNTPKLCTLILIFALGWSATATYGQAPETHVSGIQWSSNGEKILVLSINKVKAYVYDRSGKLIHTIESPTELRSINLSAGGDSIVYIDGSGIWIYNLNSGQKLMIWSATKNPQAICTDAHWLPDAGGLLYIIEHYEGEPLKSKVQKTEIFTVNSDGQGARLLATL